MSEISKFWEFCKEREMIRFAKEHEDKDFSSQDKRLSRYWFPNIRRTDDPTTVWLHGDILSRITGANHIIMSVLMFRLFNRIEVGALMRDLLINHGYDAGMLLEDLGPHKGPLFNGRVPMMMTGRTLEATVSILDHVQASEHVRAQLVGNSLERATEALQEVKGVRGIAYEVVMDLRRTPLLAEAPDVMHWACPTPPAVSGAGMVIGEDLRSTRQDDRAAFLHLIQELREEQHPLTTGWEAAEYHRALCLYYTWAREAQPLRRYRG